MTRNIFHYSEMSVNNFTVKVCKDFFDFNGKLNRSHNIVSSIHHLMYMKKEKNYTHFKFLEKSIKRESFFFERSDDFVKLLENAMENVDDGYDEKDVCWDMVGQLFFVSEKVDEIAQSKLDQYDYTNFKEQMRKKLATKLIETFGGELTAERWRIFSISMTLDKTRIGNRNSFNFHSFGLGVMTLFIVNKLF